MNTYKCRCCGSSKVMDMGALPAQTYFAGKLLNPILPSSRLYKCEVCFMLARHPILTSNEYNKLYANAEATVWSNSNRALRPDQELVLKIINNKKINNCKILDVGCYTGDLLAVLPKEYQKFGVEMSSKAALLAEEKNIEVIGSDLYQINSNIKFDIVIAIDVIEHTQNPEEFLLNLIKLLNHSGEVIISTGNADSWMWRLLKNRFWYSSFPEHISFIGENWLKRFCEEKEITVTAMKRFNYIAYSPMQIVKNAIKTALSILGMRSVGYSNTTEDHFCFSLKVNN
jgi:2-polyprenyl-3-methyl-5-hydroxy-6-metoxy-1,4-benzoquinol methylase